MDDGGCRPTGSHFSRLPVELCRDIIQSIPPANDLVNLCQVSRMFRNEAQPILYRSSELLYPDSGRILTWARTVTSRRHLAHAVHFLTLPYELPISNSSWAVSKFRTALASALKKTVNLKEITVVEDPEVTVKGSAVLLPKMMVGCSFRLHAFCGRLSPAAFQSHWWMFFRVQSGIRYWDPVHRVPGHGMMIPRDIFPELTAIVLRQTESTSNTNLLLHLGSRPIQRLSLQWEMSKGNPLYVIKWLEDLAGTVTHFNWEALGSTSLRGPSALDIIHAIIEQLPGLKFLRFVFPEADSVSCGDLLNAVSKLESIETLVLDIPMITTSSADEGAHTRHPLAEYRVKECSGLSNTFMACPTLRRFSFTLPVSDERREYPCYTRGPDGKAQLEGFDLIGKDSWRDGV